MDGHSLILLFLEFLIDHLDFPALCLGMPYPQNFEVAKEVQAVVRENGAVPATIAILNGIPFIGAYIQTLVMHLSTLLFLCFCIFLRISDKTADV